MKFKGFFLFFVIALLLMHRTEAQQKIQCTIQTELGSIDVVLYPERAPVTVSNFLNYVDAEAYTNSSFFRVCTLENEADREIRIEVIQGGNIPKEFVREPIVIENTQQTGLNHLDGTLSMARGGPNTATSSFFICIGDQPSLDFKGKRNPDGFGFAAFGQVVDGMDVVRKIQKLENKGQYLENPVAILKIERTVK